MIATFPAEERNGRALDILETIRLVVWQRLAASTDGKRVALREYLVFNDEVRDILLSTDVEKIAAKTRELLKERGQPMVIDAKRKFDAGILSQRDYNIIVKQAKLLDKDLGI
jgi:defect-in-organelle-trafficking protein DotB